VTLRVGLAGLGIHGQRYARHLLAGDVPGARLTAVCRADATRGEAFAGEHGLAFAPLVEELAALDGVDAVVLVLPPHLHAAAALACIAAGKPLLVEKPLAHDLAAARSVADAVTASGGWLMVGHTLRFDTVVQRLREEMPSLGAPRLLAINQRFEPTDRRWIDEPGPGGILLNTAVHGFDLLRYLTGCEPESISAECGRSVTERTDDEFAATIVMQPGKLMATIDNVRSTASRSGRIEVVGERGQLAADHVHRTLVRIDGRELTDLGPLPASATIPATLTAFVEALRVGAAPPIDVRDGLWAVRLAEGAAVAAAEGRRVALAEL